MMEPYRDDREPLRVYIGELQAERLELELAIARGATAEARLRFVCADLIRLELRLAERDEGGPRPGSKRWLWILPGVALGLVAVGAGCAWLFSGTYPGRRVQSALVGAQITRNAAQLWQADGNQRSCPDLAALVADKKLDPKKTADPWGAPYRIDCTGDDIRVWSDGKDGVAGTPDDIADDFRPPEVRRVANL